MQARWAVSLYLFYRMPTKSLALGPEGSKCFPTVSGICQLPDISLTQNAWNDLQPSKKKTYRLHWFSYFCSFAEPLLAKRKCRLPPPSFLNQGSPTPTLPGAATKIEMRWSSIEQQLAVIPGIQSGFPRLTITLLSTVTVVSTNQEHGQQKRGKPRLLLCPSPMSCCTQSCIVSKSTFVDTHFKTLTLDKGANRWIKILPTLMLLVYQRHPS